jgi:hypothetical protein
MRQRAYVLIVLLALGPLPGAQEKSADFLDGFHGPQDSARISNIITTPGQFNGYTNYWHSNYWRWRQYGNLFQLSHPDVEKTIAQNKLDTAEEIGIPGLLMEEGFLAGLLEYPLTIPRSGMSRKRSPGRTSSSMPIRHPSSGGDWRE